MGSLAVLVWVQREVLWEAVRSFRLLALFNMSLHGFLFRVYHDKGRLETEEREFGIIERCAVSPIRTGSKKLPL